MRKTAIVIDDDLLRLAEAALGTYGPTATVDRALRQVVTVAARRQAIEQLRTLAGLELDDDDVLASAWR